MGVNITNAIPVILGTTGTLPKFTTPTALGNSILAESSSVLTTTGDMRVTGTIDARYPDGEWRDLLVQLVPPNSGVTIPTLTQIGTSNMWAPRWAIDDHVYLWFHAQHDIVVNLDVQFHVHWFTDGTSTNSAKWQWELWHAKGPQSGELRVRQRWHDCHC